MMTEYKPLPIGVDDFEKLIQSGYYYVDKTMMIKELMDKRGEINLFTRPRRFGKTLNMSMVQNFFVNNKAHRDLFQGVKIMDAVEDSLVHMGKYPVVNISLKSLKQPTFNLVYEQLKRVIKGAYDGYKDVLLLSAALSESEKDRYKRILDLKGDEADCVIALQFLSECLFRHYGEKTIILID